MQPPTALPGPRATEHAVPPLLRGQPTAQQVPVRPLGCSFPETRRHGPGQPGMPSLRSPPVRGRLCPLRLPLKPTSASRDTLGPCTSPEVPDMGADTGRCWVTQGGSGHHSEKGPLFPGSHYAGESGSLSTHHCGPLFTGWGGLGCKAPARRQLGAGGRASVSLGCCALGYLLFVTTGDGLPTAATM